MTRPELSLGNKKIPDQDLIFCGLLVLTGVLAFFPGLQFPFMLQWDDGTFIVFNTRMDWTLANLKTYFTRTFQDLYTPLTMVSLMIDKALFGLNPVPYHIHNLVLHLTGALFLYKIIRRFGIREWLAFAGTVLWMIHPQKVESVIWITERKDVLSGALAFASFWFFMRSTEKMRLPVISSLLAVLALITKPSTVPLPGVMTVYLICAWGCRKGWKEYFRMLFPPWILCGGVLIWSAVVTADGYPGGVETSLLIPLHNLFWYPLTAVFPQLHPIYPPLLKWGDAIHVFVFGILFAGLLLTWSIYAGLNRKKILCWGLIIGGLMVPVLGFLDYTYFDYCDRYNYLVSAGVWGFIVLLTERSLRLKFAPGALFRIGAIAGACVYFLMTWQYIPCWEKCEYLFARALEDDRPSNVKLYANGTLAALLEDNDQMLYVIGSKMIRDAKLYRKDNEGILISGHAILLHALVLRGDYEAVRPHFRLFRDLFAKRKEIPVNAEYQKFLWRDMAMTAACYSMKKEAVDYIDHYFKFLSERNIGYYTALALRSQLTDDRKQLVHALENIVRIDPKPSKYKEALIRLKAQDAQKDQGIK